MTGTLLTGDVCEQLRTVPDRSVHCGVTSPPYWALRDYGVAGQIGLESTPEEYVAKMVEVFAEVWRVLRDDGTLWLNIGDSYNAYNNNRGPSPSISDGTAGRGHPSHGKGLTCKALKPKDLVGIPWRLAFALQQPYYKWKIETEAMRAWVAGIVDGEGCITILQTKSSHSESLSYPPIVQVRMCDLDPLERLVQVVGSSYGKPQNPPSQLAANQRPSWQWKVVSDQAATVIAEIYPFLTCKRKQAIVAWNHQAFRASRGNQKRSQGDIEKEQYCKSLINSLNQRESVDIPSWMVEPAVAQRPGWYLRQDLIWAKPAPMPESVRDRCTKSHEYIFLLSKSERYYFDAIAVQEPVSGGAHHRGNGVNGKATGKRFGDKQNDSFSSAVTGLVEHRNLRDVWRISTRGFKGAHFATFPPELPERCIKAGTSERGCCPTCGAPWKRIVEKQRVATRPGADTKVTGDAMTDGNRDPKRHVTRTVTTGWNPTCKCPAHEPVPCVVLDPFFGAGTTGLMAEHLGRDWLGCELNPEYAEMARQRIAAGYQPPKSKSNRKQRKHRSQRALF